MKKNNNKRGGAFALAVTLIIGCMLAVAAPAALAQSPVSAAQTILGGGADTANTNNVSFAATNALTGLSVIDCSYQKDFGYQINFNHNGTTTNRWVFFLDASVDGLKWKTNYTTITVVGSSFGTATIDAGSINNAGIPYMRLSAIGSTNPVTVIATNITFKYCARVLVP